MHKKHLKGDSMCIFTEDITAVKALLAQYPNSSVNAFMKGDTLTFRVWVRE